MNGNIPADPGGLLTQIRDWLKDFLEAVAEARIPPGRMPVVPQQGVINMLTGGFGIVLYTVAAHMTAQGRNLELASAFLLVLIGAALLVAAAVVVLLVAKGTSQIATDWNRTASVFIVVWLLSLLTFVLLTYPSALVTGGDVILIDSLAYGLNNLVFTSTPPPWVDDLVKSMICSMIASALLLYRSKRSDPDLSLASAEPWVWLAMMTLVAGTVLHISLFYAP
jgi:hypothetical protein